MHVSITSYGVLHAGAPSTSGRTVQVDVTTALRNPHTDPDMKYRTGLEAAVREHVLATPGARQILDEALARVARALDQAPEVEVHTFCRGGRHRSVVLAEEVAAGLRAAGVHVEVEHRDVDKPVIQR